MVHPANDDAINPVQHSKVLICYDSTSFLASSVIFDRFFELHVHEGLTITHLFNDTKFAITDAILIAPTELRKNPSYFRDYLTIANSICLFIIPFILLILSNCFIAKVILRERPQSRITSVSSRCIRLGPNLRGFLSDLVLFEPE